MQFTQLKSIQLLSPLKQMMVLFQLAMTHRIAMLNFHKNAKEDKGNHYRCGTTLWKKLWRYPVVYLISQAGHKHLSTAACSERDPHALPLTWAWVLEPFTHPDTRSHSIKRCTNFGYFTSILLAKFLNWAHFCFKITGKGDISCIENLKLNGKITAGR